MIITQSSMSFLQIHKNASKALTSNIHEVYPLLKVKMYKHIIPSNLHNRDRTSFCTLHLSEPVKHKGSEELLSRIKYEGKNRERFSCSHHHTMYDYNATPAPQIYFNAASQIIHLCYFTLQSLSGEDNSRALAPCQRR